MNKQNRISKLINIISDNKKTDNSFNNLEVKSKEQTSIKDLEPIIKSNLVKDNNSKDGTSLATAPSKYMANQKQTVYSNDEVPYLAESKKPSSTLKKYGSTQSATIRKPIRRQAKSNFKERPTKLG